MDKIKSSTIWWLLSMVVSSFLFVCLLFLWNHLSHTPKRTLQLTNQTEVDEYIHHSWEALHQDEANKRPLVKVPTGIFLQSLKFIGSSEVNVSGYIWQRYSTKLQQYLTTYQEPTGFLKTQVGFILPEQVNTGSDIEPQEAYRREQANGELLIGWYFEATLRQKFDYFSYPFDHKTVWIRLWPKDFDDNIVLVPDLKAYDATGIRDIFGIDEGIVLGTWLLDTTYFDYKPTCYDTNFGIEDYIGKRDFPELYYNVVIVRNYNNAFIIHLLPLFFIAALLFSSLLIITGKDELVEKFGFNTASVFGTCSALFFVVLLAHVQLRDQFAGSSIVYMEFFFLLMYAVLLLVAVNTYVFSMRAVPSLRIIHYHDNLVPKLLYWPMILLAMVLVTLYVIYTDDVEMLSYQHHCSSQQL